MPTNLPEKKKPEDGLWLFTKVMVFLFMSGTVLLSGVVLSVWVGGMVFISTDGNVVFSLMAAIAAMMASGAGRSWFHGYVVPKLFTVNDIEYMDKVIGGKNDGR